MRKTEETTGNGVMIGYYLWGLRASIKHTKLFPIYPKPPIIIPELFINYLRLSISEFKRLMNNSRHFIKHFKLFL